MTAMKRPEAVDYRQLPAARTEAPPSEWQLVFGTRYDVKAECWEFIGARNPKGYGTAWWLGKSYGAHRLSFLLSQMRVPAAQVLHRCDNPPCIRPDHLFEGTAGDNMRDMAVKRRHMHAVRPESTARGSRVHGARLTETDIPTIRHLVADGYSYGQVAAFYDVDRGSIGHIARGTTWAHVVGGPLIVRRSELPAIALRAAALRAAADEADRG